MVQVLACPAIFRDDGSYADLLSRRRHGVRKMAIDGLLIERHGPIVVITLDRPETLNALTKEMTDGIHNECTRMHEDPDVRVVVLTGKGRGFCSGIDLKSYKLIGNPKLRSPHEILDFPQHRIARLRTFSKPTIAAVNGIAVGGGLGLALACDIRIAGDTAKFSAAFGKMGISVQDAVGAFLPQIVGVPKALEMIYTGKIVGAAEACEIGLANESVPADQLMARTMELAEQIAAGPPLAFAMSKQVIYRGLGKSLEDQLAYQQLGTLLNTAYASEDIAEAGAAFTEKRKPQFKGPR
jgi:2-(1,2-epoxy-1,2-dihydrophenyl)acetyl-CoA isomerase